MGTADLGTEVLTRLRDAQVEYVMSNLGGDKLRQQIALEVEAAVERMQTLTLNELAPAPRIEAWLLGVVQTAPLTSAGRDIAIALGRALRAAENNKHVRLKDFITRDHFEKAVDQFAELDELRTQVIRSAMASPLYSGLISDVLYYGIKDYLLSDSNVAMKIPGMGSLMKMGKGMLDKAAPNLEHAAEKAIKGYIKTNIKRTLHISEKFLDNALNSSNIKKVSEHFWTMANEGTLVDVVKRLPEDQLEKSVILIEEIWSEVRVSPHIATWLAEGVKAFYAENGDKALTPLLESLGYGQTWITDHLQQWLPELLERQALSDYLRERVRAQLTAFYQSEEAQAVFKS